MSSKEDKNDKKPRNIKPLKSAKQPRKRKSAELKRLERRKKVHALMCGGRRNWQIADELNVDEKTIRQDLAWIYDHSNIEEERKRMQEQSDWALKESYENYLTEEDPMKKKEWLNIYNQIQRTKHMAIKHTENINIINADKVQLNTVIGELIRLQEEGEEDTEQVKTIKIKPITEDGDDSDEGDSDD